MKYQYAVFMRRVSPELSEFQQVYFPVEERAGTWVPCGPMRADPAADNNAHMMLSIGEYMMGAGDDCGPLEDITPPEGWTVEARLWHPDDYVPPSQEVRDEAYERARRFVQDLRAGRKGQEGKE